MRSKPILLTLAFSALILSLSMINIDLHGIIPFKASYSSLSKEAQKQVTTRMPLRTLIKSLKNTHLQKFDIPPIHKQISLM